MLAIPVSLSVPCATTMRCMYGWFSPAGLRV